MWEKGWQDKCIENTQLKTESKLRKELLDKSVGIITDLEGRNDKLYAEVERLNKMRTHCENCGADYMATGIEAGCPCLLKAENERLEGKDTLARVQQEQVTWVKHNFENRPAWMPIMGLSEEVGELNHAFLKREQKIRTSEDHSAMIKDALADIIIFACDVATAENIDLRKALEETWDKVKKRDWKAKRQAAEQAKEKKDDPNA